MPHDDAVRSIENLDGGPNGQARLHPMVAAALHTGVGSVVVGWALLAVGWDAAETALGVGFVALVQLFVYRSLLSGSWRFRGAALFLGAQAATAAFWAGILLLAYGTVTGSPPLAASVLLGAGTVGAVASAGEVQERRWFVASLTVEFLLGLGALALVLWTFG